VTSFRVGEVTSCRVGVGVWNKATSCVSHPPKNAALCARAATCSTCAPTITLPRELTRLTAATKGATTYMQSS
jgi:hypothetical protein